MQRLHDMLARRIEEFAKDAPATYPGGEPLPVRDFLWPLAGAVERALRAGDQDLSRFCLALMAAMACLGKEHPPDGWVLQVGLAVGALRKLGLHQDGEAAMAAARACVFWWEQAGNPIPDGRLLFEV